jgi:hypothetical protein
MDAPSTPRWRRVLLSSLTLSAEACAWASVLRGDAAGAAALHVTAALLAASTSSCWLRAGSARGAALTSAALTLALPGVGAALLACVVWPSWRRSTARAAHVLEVALPDSFALRDEASASLRAPLRSIAQLLRDAESPQDRLRAVMALRHLEVARAVPLLRRAFSHPNEDIRLLSFAILARREKALRARLALGESRLASAERPGATDRRRIARLHRRLALDHWELVYAGFVSGDLELGVLDKARAHVTRALEIENDTSMALLCARIHLRCQQPEQAGAWLERAEAWGVVRASSAPLLAEAAYQRRRFAEIPAILASVRRAELRRPGLEPLAAHWLKESAEA